MRKRFVRARKRPVMRWFPCEETYVGTISEYKVSPTALVPTTAVLAKHDRATTAVSTDIQLAEEHTIVAIRGQIIIHGFMPADWSQSTPGYPTVFHLGIKVVELLPNNTPQAYDPQSAEEVDDPWMWLNHGIIASFNPYALETCSVVDVHIKTKRKLQASHALCLFMTCSQTLDEADTPVGSALNIRPYLRTLIKRSI